VSEAVQPRMNFETGTVEFPEKVVANKKSPDENLPKEITGDTSRNTFYHGDCKLVLSRENDIPTESVDLIYLDPPFYTGRVMKGMIKVTEEGVIHNGQEDWKPGAMEVSYNDSRRFWAEQGLHRTAPGWMKDIAKKNDERAAFAAYLYYMMIRLNLCKRVLKQTGSIYLHCDWRASHYLKMVMDEVFGVDSFQNEIIWHYHWGLHIDKRWNRKHDSILFYSKSNKWQFNADSVREPYSEGSIMSQSPKWNKSYNPNGRLPEDVWGIPTINGMSKERVGYPTQKPIKLLERIILASSNEGDTVLDPFCGCGTTIMAAQKLNRRWIGIDINRTAWGTTISRETQLPLGMTKGFTTSHFVSRTLKNIKEGIPGLEFEDWVNEYYNADKPFPDKGVDGITKDGIAIQTKAWQGGVNDTTISKLVMDARMHTDTRIYKPVRLVRVVSQSGFADNARAMVHRLEEEFKSDGLKIELKTPEDLLKI